MPKNTSNIEQSIENLTVFSNCQTKSDPKLSGFCKHMLRQEHITTELSEKVGVCFSIGFQLSVVISKETNSTKISKRYILCNVLDLLVYKYIHKNKVLQITKEQSIIYQKHFICPHCYLISSSPLTVTKALPFLLTRTTNM